jgi:hypothetical protein
MEFNSIVYADVQCLSFQRYASNGSAVDDNNH